MHKDGSVFPWMQHACRRCASTSVIVVGALSLASILSERKVRLVSPSVLELLCEKTCSLIAHTYSLFTCASSTRAYGARPCHVHSLSARTANEEDTNMSQPYAGPLNFLPKKKGRKKCEREERKISVGKTDRKEQKKDGKEYSRTASKKGIRRNK